MSASRPRRIAVALALAAGATILTGCVVAPVGPYYGEPVAVAPPPPQYEPIGVAPYPGWFWIGGYWGWQANRHVWIGGHWEQPRPGYRWTPHRWDQGPRGWREAPGRWERR
jgi:hypothetical protein